MAPATGLQTQYVDRPEITETFADSIHTTTFDGRTLRLELCVTRVEERKPPNARTGSRYPVCRLVMPPDAVVDLYNRLQRLIAVMEKRGVVKREARKPAPKLNA